MILLFNLNDYLGGGEVLLVRLALTMKKKGIRCEVLCLSDSYIAKELMDSEIMCHFWPIKNDSMIYMNKKEKEECQRYLLNSFGKMNIHIFTFCLRDVYNANFFFKDFNDGKTFLSTGIFHHLETKYISRLRWNKNSIIKCNRHNLLEYQRNGGLISENDWALLSNIPAANKDEYNIIPLPIPNAAKVLAATKKPNPQSIKILWIGRFVDFKILGIFNIIRYAMYHKNCNVTLVGYGPLEKQINRFIKRNSIGNVRIRGPVQSPQIKKIAKKYDIGFATGTSIMEIAQAGIPVIISPMLGKECLKRGENRCVGVFGRVEGFNIGEVKMEYMNEMPFLDETIKDVLEHYDEYCNDSVDMLHKCDLDKVTNQYIKVIFESKLQACNSRIRIPKAGIVKWIGRRVVYSLRKG